jgi:hypothetical protein
MGIRCSASDVSPSLQGRSGHDLGWWWLGSWTGAVSRLGGSGCPCASPKESEPCVGLDSVVPALRSIPCYLTRW